MTEWVAIAVDETEEPVEIPTESDGEWQEMQGLGLILCVQEVVTHFI